jgi:hypothetical protein
MRVIGAVRPKCVIDLDVSDQAVVVAHILAVLITSLPFVLLVEAARSTTV